MFFLFFVFIPRLIDCKNSSNQRKSKLLSEIFNSHNLSINHSRITRIFHWFKINRQLSNYKAHNDFEHQSLFSSKLNLDIPINQDEESNQDSNVDSIPSDDSPNPEEELAKENERRRQEILDRFHKKNRGIRQRNDRQSIKKQREMRRAKKNNKNQTENSDSTDENIEETINTQYEIKEDEQINQKENENNSEENINNHQVQNETTKSEIESNSQTDKNNPQDTNSTPNEINNTENSDDTQIPEKTESSVESNKNEENQEQIKSSTVNEENNSENQNNSKTTEENNESSEKTNKENLEHQNDSSITEDNKGNQEDQNNTEESSEETKNENSENEPNASIIEHQNNSNTTKKSNESSEELNKNKENSEHHKSEYNKTDDTNLTEKNNEKNPNTENEKLQSDQTQNGLNNDKQHNENNSQANQENGTNEESEQIDNDEPPEGPLDPNFEEDLLRNPFHEKKKELIKKMQESQSPEDKKEAKRLADEECNKAKPNTVSRSRNDCVCKPGYIGDNPITERGCWRCGDENITKQRNGRQCYHQAKCIYPGRCICEGGLMGDGITKCESPLPDIINVKPLYNPLINLDETNDKPITEGVKVFYRATYDFVPYMSYCKFDLQIVNDNDQTLTKEIESNETKRDRIGFNDNFKQFQMINGAADKDKSITCLLPPNFYRYLSDSNKQNGKCKVSISFDGLNFTQFTEFDIKETSETSADGKLLDLPPQRTPVPIRKNRVQQTRKPKVQSTGSLTVDKNILLISICIPLIVYALLWLIKPKHKGINEEEIPFLNVEDSHNKKTQYEGTRKRVIL